MFPNIASAIPRKSGIHRDASTQTSPSHHVTPDFEGGHHLHINVYESHFHLHGALVKEKMDHAFLLAEQASDYIRAYFGEQIHDDFIAYAQIPYSPKTHLAYEIKEDPAKIFRSAYLAFSQAATLLESWPYMEAEWKLFTNCSHFFQKLSIHTTQTIPEVPLLNNDNKHSLLEHRLPSILFPFFNFIQEQLPGCRTYLSCRAYITGDITSDVDLYSSASLQDIQTMLKGVESISGYRIKESSFRSYPISVAFLIFEKEEELLRMDIHCDVKQITDIANSHSSMCTNFDSNTYVATLLHGDFCYWNCFEVLLGVKLSYL
jgi:hypothetical protein